MGWGLRALGGLKEISASRLRVLQLRPQCSRSRQGQEEGGLSASEGLSCVSLCHSRPGQKVPHASRPHGKWTNPSGL